MIIFEKARDLGNAIVESDELAKLRTAEAEMQKNNEAVKIINEFQTAQQEFQQWQKEGNELTTEQKKRAEMIEEKMVNNELITAYIEAQREFERLLQQINEIISLSISGQCNDDSCGSGCSGCH